MFHRTKQIKQMQYTMLANKLNTDNITEMYDKNTADEQIKNKYNIFTN